MPDAVHAGAERLVKLAGKLLQPCQLVGGGIPSAETDEEEGALAVQLRAQQQQAVKSITAQARAIEDAELNAAASGDADERAAAAAARRARGPPARSRAAAAPARGHRQAWDGAWNNKKVSTYD